MDDLLDDHGQPHRQGSERRRHEEDRRDVGDRGDGDDPAVRQLDRDEFEHHGEAGQDHEGRDPRRIVGVPAGSRQKEARGRRRRQDDDEADGRQWDEAPQPVGDRLRGPCARGPLCSGRLLQRSQPDPQTWSIRGDFPRCAGAPVWSLDLLRPVAAPVRKSDPGHPADPRAVDLFRRVATQSAGAGRIDRNSVTCIRRRKSAGPSCPSSRARRHPRPGRS